MQIDYKMSEQQYVEFNLHVNKKRTFNKSGLFTLMLPIIGAFIYGLFELSKKACLCGESILEFSKSFLLYVVPIILVIYVVGTILLVMAIKIQAKKFYKEVKDTFEGSLSIADDMLVEQTKNAIIKTEFKKLKIYKDKKNFYIMISTLQGYILPMNEKSEEFIEKLCKKADVEVQK